MKKILICEDEGTIRDFVIIHLKRAGYEVTATKNGAEAIKAFEKADNAKVPFDVAVLDIMMPGPPDEQGDKVCKLFREKNQTMGIIMLSAKAQEMDKVGCLMNGADDYITKPFSPSELVARLDAVYRRVEALKTANKAAGIAEAKANEPLKDAVSGVFKVNAKSRTVTKNGELLELTQVEYQILDFFIRNEEAALERKSILAQIWGDSYYGDEKIVDVNIRRLRMKIEEDPSKPEFLQTVWGYGYKWSGGEKTEQGNKALPDDAQAAEGRPES
ncbi:MAG: response regulator transcription factor [Oscillospiraceae bacterium]|nr:response regulator transcription factor [Oscillospiraceae bacterium]